MWTLPTTTAVNQRLNLGQPDKRGKAASGRGLPFGQDSVLQVWTRLILPNGKSVVLERLPSMDTEGHAGLEDEVDHHWSRLIGAAALSSILGVGTELGDGGDENELLQALRRAGGDTLNDVGQEIVRRNLDIPSTITIRQGFPIRVMVSRDLVLEPYRE